MAEFLAWKSSPDKYFGDHGEEIEKLRLPLPKDAPFDLVETSYFGFYIPEAALVCQIYYWFHPVSAVASGGLLCYQGLKNSQMEADYIEYRNYMPMPEDITRCVYANGVSIRMLEPLRRFEITFDDDATDTHLQLTTSAIMPPAFRPTGGHFTQAMKNCGQFILKGKPYKIDSYFSRDRSWGDPRHESRLDIPPIGWHVGVFSDDLAFHVIAFDSPEHVQGYRERYAKLYDGSNLIWGYIWRSGRLLGIKRCRRQTTRAANGIFTANVALHLTDAEDVEHQITGVVRARYPFAHWPNTTNCYHFTQWRYGDRAGYGDTQESYYNNFIQENLRSPAVPA
ncbi:MAG TPA: hypothetical protein VJQ47_13250 [Steroidobacteraceae bacterium]|nr:hypothetical protein [Steroidobacteraceae bacterium]